MGICVQDSGIAVEKGRYYLVNLNADPSLNEMLVYYLKVIDCSIIFFDLYYLWSMKLTSGRMKKDLVTLCLKQSKKIKIVCLHLFKWPCCFRTIQRLEGLMQIQCRYLKKKKRYCNKVAWSAHWHCQFSNCVVDLCLQKLPL